MLLKFAFKSVISRRSSLVIILFISFAVCLFCVANAVFDSTEQGIQANYIASFTGDFVILPQSKMQQSLFGDETPVTGELTVLNTVVPYEEIKKTIEAMPEVEGSTGQISGSAAAERDDGSNRIGVYLFGVDGAEYISIMKSIHIIKGAPYVPGDKGVMLCKQVADSLDVDVGDSIQFIVADGPNYKIRAANVSAIFEYDIYNDIFGRFILTDPVTVRNLMGITEGYSSNDFDLNEGAVNLFAENNDFTDFDDLFSEASDYDEALLSDGFIEEHIDDENETKSEVSITPYGEITVSTTWNYIIVRLKDGKDTKRVMKKVSKLIKEKGWPVKVIGWRYAAGSTVVYLLLIRYILNLGIIVILFAGFIIVNNSLVINILDRTREIGTLRAIGAKKRYISLQCMVENLILTLTSGVFGVILGFITSFIINKAHIVLHNYLLVQLFGSEAISVHVTGGNIFILFILVLALALLGWIYPVINALKVTPIDAIQGAK